MNARVYPARFYRSIKNGKIQCTLCPRGCRLSEGQRGSCFIRYMENGKMVLSAYGQNSGLAIDPIEKKPLFHFYPGSSVLSFGTAGCNLTCGFCQNWNLSRSKEIERLSQDGDPDKIAHIALQRGSRSVAFTYNDPIIFHEYAIDTAIECHKLGIKTVAVTSGYVNDEPRREFYNHIDAANVDLKGFSETFYRKFCTAKLGPVLDTLLYIANETDVWLEITTLLIPGANDSDAEIEAMSRWIATNLSADVPLHFSAFHPDYKVMDRGPTPLSTLIRARKIALANGMRYVYTGNLRHPEGESTFCPGCGSLLIERHGFRIQQNRIGTGRCPDCRTEIAGRFEREKGE